MSHSEERECHHDPSHSHSHAHAHVHGATSGPKLWLSLVVTLCFVLGEAVAGRAANSLALLSDAGHNFSDALSLGLAAYAVWISHKPANARKTFGYHRVAILTALFNAATLILVGLSILVEAYRFFLKPEPVNGDLMLWVAAAAFAMNTVIAYLLRDEESLNMRAAFLHMAGDAAAALGVLIAAVILKRTGWMYADPLVSVLIALLILYSSWCLIRETTDILLESAPKGLDMGKLVEAIRSIEHVRSVHDLHAWTVSDGLHYLSCHVVVADTRSMTESSRLIERINRLLADQFGIAHATIQIEIAGCCVDTAEDPLFCGETTPTLAHRPA
jgi:cobalt-zinc-cadmium efflux system protein